MDTSQESSRGARVLGPKDGEVAGAPEFRTRPVHDRRP